MGGRDGRSEGKGQEGRREGGREGGREASILLARTTGERMKNPASLINWAHSHPVSRLPPHGEGLDYGIIIKWANCDTVPLSPGRVAQGALCATLNGLDCAEATSISVK